MTKPAMTRATTLQLQNEALLPAISAKLDALRKVVAGYGRALICFSGGVDSTLLLKVAADTLGDGAVALLARSPSLAAREQQDAIALANELAVQLIVVESHEVEQQAYRDNPTDRCYFCKSELLSLAVPAARARGIEAVCLGTNLDDLGDHRPGLRAANENDALHPLVEAGFTKDDVRAASQALGLRTWNKPQLACLSSRFPYGTEITPERLARVDQFEAGLVALGFSQVRVRFHEPVARLEIEEAELSRALEPDIRRAIVALGQAAGFSYIALDLAGFRSGSMNAQLVSPRRLASRQR